MIRPDPVRVQVEVLSWVNRFVGGPGTGEVVLAETVTPGTTVRALLRRLGDRHPALAEALWVPGRGR